MAKQGYIKLSRGYFDDPLWNEARVYSKAEAWLDLIQQARFEASTELIAGKVIEIQRGEIPASRRYLEVRWKWGSSKVTTYMKILAQMGRINQRQTNGQTVYRLLNYGLYNDAKPQANQEQPTPEPPPNQNKGSKEEKELNYSFDDFWNAYDKKVGDKKKLRPKWEKLSDDERQRAISHVPFYLKATPNKKYRQNPERYLNNKTWNDEIINTNINEISTTHPQGSKQDSVHASIAAEVEALQ